MKVSKSLVSIEILGCRIYIHFLVGFYLGFSGVGVFFLVFFKVLAMGGTFLLHF